jgi:hypothetical protein
VPGSRRRAVSPAPATSIRASSAHGAAGEQWRAHAELAQVLAGRGDTSGATAELGKAPVIVERLAAAIQEEGIRRTFLDGARTCYSCHRPVPAA